MRDTEQQKRNSPDFRADTQLVNRAHNTFVGGENTCPDKQTDASDSTLSQIVFQQQQTIEALRQSIEQKDKTICQISSWLREADKINEQNETKASLQNATVDSLRGRVEHLEWAYRQKSEEFDTISNAFFWKITKPLRVIMDVMKKVFKNFKFTALLWKGLKCLKDNGIRYTFWKIRQKVRQGKTGNLIEAFDLSETQKVKTVETYIPDPALYEKTIDIILPVYNGWRILPPLLSSVSRTQMRYRLIIVDDKSTDGRILPMLRTYAAEHENVTLVENEKNLGYTGSINKALSMTQGDVVLLNSDIRLPELWLERLVTPIILQPDVASATPFTNSGEICSFPEFCKNNKLFLGMTVDEIDQAFSKVIPTYTTLPTGVGFCMAISRRALEKVGLYDEKHFAIGYGEENDWCQRAISKGFRNVMVENLFVYHQHGATFTPERKKQLIQQNHQELLKKHRNYDRDVSVFCKADPVRKIRESVKLALLNSLPVSEAIVAFDHAWGGGATSYLQQKTEDITDRNGRMIVIRYKENQLLYTVSYYYEDLSYEFFAKKLEDILQILPAKPNEVWINELVSYPNLFETQRIITEYAKKEGTRLIFRLHDFFCICPRITLLDDHEEFCTVKSAAECDRCSCAEADMIQWRDEWEDFLSNCDEITAFSKDSISHLEKAYPKVSDRVKLIPHQPKPIDKVQVTPNRRHITVGLLGGLSVAKGLHIVQKMCKLIDRRHLPVRIKLIGYAGEPMNSYKCYSQTGPYTLEELPDLIEENQVDIIFISSIWPETFSYTASEAISMGLPVACFDLGAPVERVEQYEKGLVIDKIDARRALEQIMEFVAAMNKGIGQNSLGENSGDEA